MLGKFPKTILFLFIAGLVFVLSVKEIRHQHPKQETKQKNLSHKFNYGPGTYDFHLIHDNLKRNYTLYAPKNYNKKQSLPLLIALHGGGGSAKTAPGFFELNPKADKENFIVVYPEGTGVTIGGTLLGTWNGGDCCGPAADNNIDDVGFIKKMIEKVENDFNIDKKRIYATGMSNGAIMTYRLACELSETITAIAPVASIGHFRQCNNKRAVPTLHIHGTDDPCAPYDGCKECQSCIQKYLSSIGIPVKKRYSQSVSVPTFINKWRQKNGCSESTVPYLKKNNAKCVAYQNCKENADVVLCSVKGMGHTWPGRSEYYTKACQENADSKKCLLWKSIVGNLNTDISANDLIWDFFKKYSLN